MKNLKNHMMIHTVEGKDLFTCKYCKKVFNFMDSRKKHESNCEINAMKRKTTYRNEENTYFICDICNKGLSSKKTIRLHMAIHMKRRRFECNHCSKTFTSKYTLIGHKRRIHTPK